MEEHPTGEDWDWDAFVRLLDSLKWDLPKMYREGGPECVMVPAKVNHARWARKKWNEFAARVNGGGR